MFGLRTCAVDDCTTALAPRRGRLCPKHEARLRRNGSVDVLKREHPTTCTFPGCDKPYEARGYCDKHYQRLKSKGSAEEVTREQRFFAKVTETTSGCWEWNGALNKAGYGMFNGGDRRARLAHRWLYEHLVTNIPSGLHLDHLCRNRRCVNPEHLEPVTTQVNTARALAARAVAKDAA